MHASSAFRFFAVAPVALFAACTSSSSSPLDASADVAPDLPNSLACIGSVTWPTPTAAQVSLGAQFVDFTTAGAGTAPQAQLDVKACARSDGTCVSPLATGKTAADGTVSLTVPTGANGFDGFFDVTGGDRFPELAFWLPPVVEDQLPTANGRGIGSVATMASIAAAAGTTLDPSRGHLAVRIRDCTKLLTVTGATVAMDIADSRSKTLYMSGGAFASGSATDASGLAAILNLPVGVATITIALPLYGRTLGTAKVFIRAGAFTTVGMSPTP